MKALHCAEHTELKFVGSSCKALQAPFAWCIPNLSLLQSKSCRAVVYFILFYFVLMHVYTTLNKGLDAVEGFDVSWNENSA